MEYDRPLNNEYFESLSPTQRFHLNPKLNIILNEESNIGDVKVGGDPYSNVLTNKANRLHQRNTNQPEETKEHLLGITAPLAMRALVNGLTAGKDLTEADLTPSEQAILRQTIQTAELARRGGRPYDGVKYSDYNNPKPFNTISAPEALFRTLFDKEFNITNSLGQFNYHTDKNGNIIVTDRYDFNSDTTPKGKGFKDTLRREYIEPNNKPFNWNINLGNPKDWTREDIGI